VIEVMPPAAEQARWVLRAYFEDVAARFYGRPATENEVAAAMREDPSDDLMLPHGLILVAHEEGAVLGCAGLRLMPGNQQPGVPVPGIQLPSRTGEVTRVFVVPAARRRGLGSRLLNDLESHARRHGVATLRLDTRSDLTEARRLYARHGYREVPAFSQGPYADHWFEKTLS
jgi:ribosomal protein S18 acetylase RimI-like enzyme